MAKQNTKNKKFRFIPHTADIKFQAFGSSLKEVFENSALAMFMAVYDKKIRREKNFGVSVKGKDLESLMYLFLEEFLVLIDSMNFLPSGIKILKFDEKKLEIKAEVTGDNAKNYKVSEHIKSVTYNEMFIKKQNGKWVAQVVLDV